MRPAGFIAKKWLPILICFSVLGELSAQLASKGNIYAATLDGKIYQLNKDYSERQLVVQTDLPQIISLAINSLGEVYAADRFSLYRIDLLSGVATVVAAAPTAESQFQSIAFNRSDQLYIVESRISGGFLHNLLTFNFENNQFELRMLLSNLDDARINSLAFDPYTDTPFYIYKSPFFDNVMLAEIRNHPSVPKTSEISGVDQGLINFDSLGRLTIIEEEKIDWIDRISARIYAKELREIPAYSSISSMMASLGSLPPILVEVGPIMDFETIALGRTGERQVSISNQKDEAVLVEFHATVAVGATIRLPESLQLAPGELRTLSFKLHVEAEGTFSGQIRFQFGNTENGFLNINYQATGFAVHPIDIGSVYALSRSSIKGPSTLNLVDLKNRETVPLCTLSKPIEMISANSRGLLYGVIDQTLFLIDAESGNAHELGSLGIPPRSIAFDLSDSLYLVYIDLEDGSIPYVYLNKFDVESMEIAPSIHSIISGPGFSSGAGRLAVSADGRLAMLGENGLALGEISLFGTNSVFPSDHIIENLPGLKDIVFSRANQLTAYGSTLGTIDTDEGGFKTSGISIPGFVSFVKHVSASDLLRMNKAESLVYPNPIKEQLTLLFEITEASDVQLEVVSSDGRKIAVLNAYFEDVGPVRLKWDGKDATGNRLKEGIYLLRLIVNNKLLSVTRAIVEP